MFDAADIPVQGLFPVFLAHDPKTGAPFYRLPAGAEDLVDVRAKKPEPHFARFVQLSNEEGRGLDLLLTLSLAESRVLLTLVRGMARDNRVPHGPAEVIASTGLAPAVVSRALTKLWRRDLLRPTGRVQGVRAWMVSPAFAYRGPAAHSSRVLIAWNHLDAAADTT
jgi:hypothetical protein